jgi:hypothetical protein
VTRRAAKDGVRSAKGAAVRKKSPCGKKAAATKRTKPKAREPAPLERLRSDESTQALRSLASRHPELRREIDELALVLIASVDSKKLGAELGQRLLEVDIFDATDAPRRDGRYIPVWEAAQQTLDGLLAPHLTDLHRRIELGLKEAAQSTCLGIVLGLYRARDGAVGDSLLAHAPDFCENEASYVVGLLAKQSGRLQRRRWTLPEGSHELLPDWPWLFSRDARRTSRRGKG